MKNNPDDRSDNVERIQRNINSTLENINLANEMMSKTDDQKTIKDLEERNKRREKSLKGLRKEIKDEAIANEIKEEVLSKEISIK
ncbi:Small, acid-soluble spore protein Tlp [bioreactor metagenome]|jgi:small acid-soluble spore protein (thioredoxin-like protein)|uniref:Protein Tlp homolog n=2 Tax=root TaxID=1 RepID=R9BU09_9CLOT|nr:small acid-soluble spore protein Tlp [Clostridium sartagoforme]EOR20492.1 small acid-soluble spore protein Tlp [Clostridium sartagoforme AAU1]